MVTVLENGRRNYGEMVEEIMVNGRRNYGMVEDIMVRVEK